MCRNVAPPPIICGSVHACTVFPIHLVYVGITPFVCTATIEVVDMRKWSLSGVVVYCLTAFLFFTSCTVSSYQDEPFNIHQTGNGRHLNTYGSMVEGPRYVVTVDPDNETATDNKTCLPNLVGGANVPCKSLEYAFQHVQFHNLSSVAFHLVSPSSNYSLQNVTTFKHLTEISIIGNSSTNLSVVIECGPNAGLSFLNTSNITIDNIRFLHCGAQQSSTSRDFTMPKMQMVLINVVLYFYNCTDVIMHRVEVVNGYQATGVVMYDTNGKVQVDSCLFADNTADDGVPGGGGFAVEFTYCSPGDTSCTNNLTEYDPGYRRDNVVAEYVFTDCHFEGNIARGQNFTNNAGNFIFASLANHTAIGRGGGLSVFFKGEAVNKSVNVTDCHFINNRAVWGGGLLIEMDDNTMSNKVHISHCNFTNNHAFFNDDYGTGGGGLRVAITVYFWNTKYKDMNYTRNEILVNNSNFTGNKAIEGGAISFSVARQRLSYFSQVTYLLVSDCSFDGNGARLGAAATVTTYPIFSQGFIPSLTFYKCYFSDNHVDNHLGGYNNKRHNPLHSHPSGMGTVYVGEVPVTFSSLVTFSNNRGSALAVVGAQVDFSGTVALFYNNSGTSGGGIALLGASSILTGPSTTVVFTENHASVHGGAIYNQYISKEDLKSNVNCFVRYSDPFIDPFNWEVNFRFTRNTGKKLGNSIYSTAILPCSWGIPARSIFCNAEHWHYTESNCYDEIFTEPKKVEPQYDIPSIKVFPGHGFVLPLDAVDDFNHTVNDYAVYVADIEDPTAEVEPSYTYVSHNYVGITGEPDTNVTMNMYTAGSRTTFIKLTLSIQQCPPGFVQYIPIVNISHTNDTETEYNPTNYEYTNNTNYEYTNNTEVNKAIACECPKQPTFRGNLRCLGQEFHSQIHNRYWFGMFPPQSQGNDSVSETNSEYVMGLVPQYYTTKALYGDEFIDLPNNSNSTDESICGGGNRKGTLCGQCRQGYAVAINSPTYECVPCNNTATAERVGYLFAYIALTYLPILGLFLAIIIFNFKLTSSAALSFVLFAQMVGSGVFNLTAGEAVYLNDHKIERVETAYTAIYGLFNLNSFSFLIKHYCINEHLTTLDVLTLEYVTAAFPLIMIAIIHLAYRCSAIKCHCYRRRDRRLRGADPSSTTTLQSTDTSRESEKRTPKNTLIHAFVAFLFLSYTKFSLASMFTMSVTELFNATGDSRGHDFIYFAGHLRFNHRDYLLPYGLLAIIILIFVVILPPLLLLGPIQFVDWLIDKRGFGCLHRVWPSITIHTFLDTFQGFYKPNRRFFSGVYFLFRLAVFVNFSFSRTVIAQYLFQQVAVMVLIALVALFRPYTREFYNYLDILILSDLGIINALAIYIFSNKSSGFPYKVYTVECVLVWLPLVYMICYAVWNRVHKRKHYNTVKVKLISLINPVKSSQETGTDEEYERLLSAAPDIFADKSLEESGNTTSDDPDEGLFRRAARRNRYSCNIQSQPPLRPGGVTTSVVSVMETPGKVERDLVKRDSGTSTGESSRTGSNSNDS